MQSGIPDAVSDLFEAMNQLVPPHLYPSGVQPIPAVKIAGTAFFPGGSGLYLEGRDPASVEFPVGGVIVLGHNFDSETGFNDSVKRGKERLTTGTWGRLLKMLRDAEVPVDRCFFTNAFMGLCEGDDSFDYGGRAHGAFRAACGVLLRAQIEILRPRLILTLGLYVPPMIAELSPDLGCWMGRELVLKDLNRVPIHEAGFRLSGGSTHRAFVVPIAHPSMPNSRHRKPMGFSEGRQGEVELLQAGWQESLR